MISFIISEQTPMSEDTTRRCPSVSSLSIQMSIDREARSPHIGTITSVSSTGFPKSSTTKRRAPKHIQQYSTIYSSGSYVKNRQKLFMKNHLRTTKHRLL